MSQTAKDGMCEETTGVLFSHRCDRFSVQTCARCDKALCQDHGHPAADGIACTSCLKRERQGVRQDETDSRTRRNDYYDDPYFYGPRWYPGYGRQRRHDSADDSPSSGSGDADAVAHDPNDFTEGDATSLRVEGDSAFETDMGES